MAHIIDTGWSIGGCRVYVALGLAGTIQGRRALIIPDQGSDEANRRLAEVSVERRPELKIDL